MNNNVTTTIEKITKVLNNNYYRKGEYSIQISENEKCWFIHIYTQYIDFITLENLRKNNINIITIWPDEHEFVYTLNEKIPCTKTTIAIQKYK